jgi:predicted nucleic acid-binding Zn ribbon protein
MTLTPAPAAQPGTEPTHGCVRCGAPIPIADGMCENCNPLGLKQPAASQAHGTVVLGIVVAVIVLFVLAKISIHGVGPFQGVIGGVVSAPPGLAVTVTVTNEGTATGSTTCRIYDPTIQGIGPESTYADSPQVPPGQTVSFSKQVSTLGTVVRPLAVSCSNP